MTFGAVPVSVPCAGAVAIANVIGSPSGSEPVRTIATGWSSATVMSWLSATGGRSAPTTWMVTVPAVSHSGSGAAFVVPSSQTVYVNAAGPA